MSAADDIRARALAILAECDRLEAAISQLEAVGQDMSDARAKLEDERAGARKALEMVNFGSKPLTVDPQHGIVGTMTPEHRQAISSGTMGKSDRFLTVLQKHGIPSLRALAEKLDVQPSFLTRIRQGKRPMPPWMAEKIEELTAGDWPKSKW